MSVGALDDVVSAENAKFTMRGLAASALVPAATCTGRLGELGFDADPGVVTSGRLEQVADTSRRALAG